MPNDKPAICHTAGRCSVPAPMRRRNRTTQPRHRRIAASKLRSVCYNQGQGRLERAVRDSTQADTGAAEAEGISRHLRRRRRGFPKGTGRPFYSCRDFFLFFAFSGAQGDPKQRFACVQQADPISGGPHEAVLPGQMPSSAAPGGTIMPSPIPGPQLLFDSSALTAHRRPCEMALLVDFESNEIFVFWRLASPLVPAHLKAPSPSTGLVLEYAVANWSITPSC